MIIDPKPTASLPPKTKVKRTVDDTRFVAALDELAAITERVLGHGSTCRVLKQGQLISKEKLQRAISAANDMQKKNFRERTLLNNGRK